MSRSRQLDSEELANVKGLRSLNDVLGKRYNLYSGCAEGPLTN